MKRFNFSLNVILKLKENKEETCRIALGKIISTIEKLNKLKDETRRILCGLQISQYPTDYEYVELYRQRLQMDWLDYDSQLNEEEEKRKMAQIEYIAALNQLLGYEKIKEKRFQQYRKEVNKEELKYIDELNQIRTNREISYGR